MVEALAAILAGVGAGMVNTIVGSGTLISFPTLLLLGHSPVSANVTNTVGLVPGSLSGAIGYRRELAGQAPRMLRLGLASAAGGLAGGAVLLIAPPEAFELVVPLLLFGAVGLVAFQPRLRNLVGSRHGDQGTIGVPLLAGTFATGVYGGYFGAAQGVILLSILAVLAHDSLQRLNALKNVLVAVVNGVAAALFALIGPVDWTAVLFLAIGATAGGQLGAHVGRRLPASVLRAAIMVVGTVTGLVLLLT
ncbi:MAG TPA: sulfite exporter TauE/SafE family protein [Candidatus Tectomicrobia bacterium]|nr:sulfite exporter TauE/SafE family protein [Candidatus Tectomicrobia bacterium]